MNRFKVAIVGPESTGKSTLAKQLAEKYQAHCVTEYARQYIEQLDEPYSYEDLLVIAKTQKQHIDEAFSAQKKILFADTSLLTIEIWCRDKFGKCHSWIVDNTQKERFDLYLLCDIDIPWVFDIQREDAHRRVEILDVYLQTLNKYGFLFNIVTGKDTERLNNAVQFIKPRLNIES